MKLPRLTFHISNISIARYFLFFSVSIFVLTFILYFHFSQQIRSQKDFVTLENQSVRLERALEDNIEYSSYLMKYLCNQIKFRDVRNLGYINKLLSSFGLKSVSENNTMWNMFSWVDSDMNLVVNSSFGIVDPISIKDRDYAPLLVSQPNIIHLGKTSYGKVSKELIIPAGMGVTDKNGKYLGAVVFGFRIKNIVNTLEQALTGENIVFAVYDYKLNKVLSSDKFVADEKTVKILGNLINSEESSGLIDFDTSFFHSQQDKGFYQKLEEYSYILVVKHDDNFVSKEAWSRIFPYIFETFTIASILVMSLYLLKVIIIIPIQQLSQASKLVAQDRDDEVVMPNSSIAEIKDLITQISLIERYKISLLQAKKSQERFFANMSHELRTPLNGILNFSMMMQKEMFGPLDAEYKEMASDIHASGVHLLNLVNDILDFSKMDIGKMKLSEEKFSVVEEAKASLKIVLSEFEGHEKNNEIKILSEIKIGDLEFFGDRRMFKQILLNLISNAAKFTERGHIILRLFIDDQKSLVLEVEDTGIGIKEEDMNKLAVEFGQVGDGYSRGRKQGTGLGLFLVKKMAELHGGSFEINSVYQKGTTVKVTFPSHRLITKNGIQNV